MRQEFFFWHFTSLLTKRNIMWPFTWSQPKVNDIWVEIHYSQLKRYEALAVITTTSQPNMWIWHQIHLYLNLFECSSERLLLSCTQKLIYKSRFVNLKSRFFSISKYLVGMVRNPMSHWIMPEVYERVHLSSGNKTPLLLWVTHLHLTSPPFNWVCHGRWDRITWSIEWK